MRLPPGAVLRYKAGVGLRASIGMGLLCCALLLSACTSKKLVLGEQCPRAGTEGSSLAPDASLGSGVYGTSCAPCDGRVEYDDRGCPVLVTWESCGGDICIGNALVPRTPLDAGSEEDGGDEDAATEEDAGGR